jgi:nicotinamidase-related amidase
VQSESAVAVEVEAEPWPWPLLGPADPAAVALLIIDMQVDFVRPGGWFAAHGFDLSTIQSIVPRLQELLDAARQVPGLLVVHTRQGNAPDLSDLPATKREQSHRAGNPFGASGPYGRGLVRGEPGWEIVAELAPIAGERVLDKPGFGAFTETDLDEWLRGRGVRSLIVTGVTANVCVLSSLYAAVDLGYDCLTLIDAIAGIEPGTLDCVSSLIRYQGGLFGALSTVDDAVKGFTAAR